MRRFAGLLAVFAVVLFSLVQADALPRYPMAGRFGQPVKSLVVTSMTGMGTGGGIVIVGTSNFTGAPQVSYCTTVNVTPCPSNANWVSVPITSYNSTSITTNFPALALGNYDIVISSAGGDSVTRSQFLHVLSITTPSALWGAALVGEWPCDNAAVDSTCPAGANCINNLPDSTANANDLPQATNANKPIKIPGDPDCNGHASCSFTAASSQFLQRSSLAFGAGHTLVFGGAVKYTSSSASMAVFAYANTTSNIQNAALGLQGMVSSSTFTSNIGVSPTNGDGLIFLLQNVGATSTTGTGTLQTDNVTASTASYSGFGWPVTAGALEVGRRNSGQYADMKVCELVAVNTAVNSTDATTFSQYLVGQYNITSIPAITATGSGTIADEGATRIHAATGSTSMRLAGTGFRSGMTAILSATGISPTALTVAVPKAGEVELTGIPSVGISCNAPDSPGPATCTHTTLDLENSDTQEILYTDRIIFTNVQDPMVSEGINCKSWQESVRAADVTSGLVTSWFDWSLNQQPLVQATSANEGTYNAADAIANNHDTITFTGANPTYYTVAAYTFGGTTGQHCADVVYQTSTTSPGTQQNATDFAGSSGFSLQYVSGTPKTTSFGTAKATWGSALTVNTLHELLVDNDGSNASISVDGATAVTGAWVNSFTDGSAHTFGRRLNTQWPISAKVAGHACFLAPPSNSNLHSWSNVRFATP